MKKTKGISLIVLVITIIVMIIISGAIILTLTQTNVIDQAEQAKDKYNLSQIKESVNLERTNALLARYETTNNVNISVKELLGLTDEDAMNVTATNTVPANMSAGKYYKLDVTRYGIESVGTIVDDQIKGIYVINDDYDVYYVVEGTTSEVAQDIDDEKVAEILMACVMGTKDEATAVTELKQELYIEDTEVNKIIDIAWGVVNPITGEGCFYFFAIDRIYVLKIDTMQMEYASKEENGTLYTYAAKVEQIRQELEKAFVGNTVAQIQAKHTDSILEQYILDNCHSIKGVEVYSNWDEDNFINYMSFDYGNYEEEDFGRNTIKFIIDENQKYIGVTIEAGS